MKIVHDEYGEKWVSGQSKMFIFTKCWEGKEKATYFEADGWQEYKEPQVVNVTGECNIRDGGEIMHKDTFTMRHHGYTRSKVQRYHLPVDWYKRWLNADKELSAFVNQYLEPCIIVTKTV